MKVIYGIVCLMALGCGDKYSRVVFQAEQDAHRLTNQIDNQVYLSLSERQATRDLIRSELEYIYTNNCQLR